MKCMSEAVYVVSHYSVSRTALKEQRSENMTAEKRTSC